MEIAEIKCPRSIAEDKLTSVRERVLQPGKLRANALNIEIESGSIAFFDKSI